MAKRALIVVDVQNDFCPGGALAVPKGDEVVPVINQIVAKFDLVVATQDWHPENHCSFVENGGQWPRHCVQDAWGAEWHADLWKAMPYGLIHVRKGFRQNEDAYSGFRGNFKLEEWLRYGSIEDIYVCGLATDYCVKETAFDAKRAGFTTFVVIDACRGVNVKKSDVAKAVKEMRRAGVKIITSKDIV